MLMYYGIFFSRPIFALMVLNIVFGPQTKKKIQENLNKTQMTKISNKMNLRAKLSLGTFYF